MLYFAKCCAPSTHLFFRSHKDSGPVLLKISEDLPRWSRHSPQAEQTLVPDPTAKSSHGHRSADPRAPILRSQGQPGKGKS